MLRLDVDPLCLVQSNLSVLSCVQPQKPVSNVHCVIGAENKTHLPLKHQSQKSHLLLSSAAMFLKPLWQTV